MTASVAVSSPSGVSTSIDQAPERGAGEVDVDERGPAVLLDRDRRAVDPRGAAHERVVVAEVEVPAAHLEERGSARAELARAAHR